MTRLIKTGLLVFLSALLIQGCADAELSDSYALGSWSQGYQGQWFYDVPLDPGACSGFLTLQSPWASPSDPQQSPPGVAPTITARYSYEVEMPGLAPVAMGDCDLQPVGPGTVYHCRTAASVPAGGSASLDIGLDADPALEWMQLMGLSLTASYEHAPHELPDVTAYLSPCM